MVSSIAKLALIGVSALLLPAGLQACSGNEPGAETEPEAAEQQSMADGKGLLTIRANGEDFVRQGFTTKDGWQLTFEHVYLNLADVTAYQSDPPFEPEAGDKLNAKAEVSIPGPVVVDLAAGDATADPILVGEVEAPAGRYNALSWKIVPTDQYSIYIAGTATKDGQTLPFTLGISEALTFACGDFVGDERKGILAKDATADLEATFHFDHLFGDGEAPAEDDINTGALGFAPLAALAQNGTVTVDSASLETSLTAEDYATYRSILPSLGHVGEGHCEETNLKI